MSGALEDPFGWVGHTVAGKLRVDAVIAEGGFGVVYRAHHVGFDAPVALKCLKVPARLQGADRDKFLKAFLAEGKLLHQLSRSSAGIVQALDLGAAESPNGTWTPYLALEWLDGATLADWLAKRALGGAARHSLSEAIALLDPAARALALAHEHNVAHRDIKPANLFVTEIAGRRTMKVVDFGIAKVMSDMSNMTLAFKETGVAIDAFTPLYGAPEQFDRVHGATGPWTDVFAFALVMVEVLGGRAALDGENTTQLHTSSTRHDPRPTPHARGVSVTHEVEQLFARALAVSPKDRFASLGRFWEALVAEASRVSPAVALAATAPATSAQTASPSAVAGPGLAATEMAAVVPVLGAAPGTQASSGADLLTAIRSLYERRPDNGGRDHAPISPFVGAAFRRPGRTDMRLFMLGINAYVDDDEWADNVPAPASFERWFADGSYRFHKTAAKDAAALAEKLPSMARTLKETTFAGKESVYLTNFVKTYVRTSLGKREDQFADEEISSWRSHFQQELEALATHGALPHVLVVYSRRIWEFVWQPFWNAFQKPNEGAALRVHTYRSMAKPPHYANSLVVSGANHERQPLLLLRLRHPSARDGKATPAWLLSQAGFEELMREASDG